MVSPWLVFRTVRDLRFSQWFWRLRRKLEPWFSAPLSAPPPDALTLDPVVLPTVPLAHDFLGTNPGIVRDLSQGLFTFLNQSKKLGFPHPDWLLGPRREDRLWAVTLHYHSWAYPLARQAPELFIPLVSDWIERCDLGQPGASALAWNPYAVATRVGWWCRCYAALGPAFWRGHPDFQKLFLTSLWRQADFLSRNVEWDLRANHLIRDGLGLAWAGRFFSPVNDPRPKKWTEQAERLLKDQAREQVLADGGHFERSPMYHLQVMEDLLQAACLSTHGGYREGLRAVWRRMADAAGWVRHPDGTFPLLNDAALNGAPDPAQAIQAGADLLGSPLDETLRQGLRYFPRTGLVVWQGERFSVFFDVGPLGPDEQPGHGHADNLTLELSWRGQRLFVDPGTYAYDEDGRRASDRSTLSHNTVAIDGKDSSEVWKIFRVGRRAKPLGVEVNSSLNGFQAKGAHQGYDFLPGKPRHSREMELDGKSFRITDRLTGRGNHSLSGGFLLAPGWEARVEADGWRISQKNNILFMGLRAPSGLKWAVEKAPYHPQFGQELTVLRLTWNWTGPIPFSVEFTFEDEADL